MFQRMLESIDEVRNLLRAVNLMAVNEGQLKTIHEWCQRLDDLKQVTEELHDQWRAFVYPYEERQRRLRDVRARRAAVEREEEKLRTESPHKYPF